MSAPAAALSSASPGSPVAATTVTDGRDPASTFSSTPDGDRPAPGIRPSGPPGGDLVLSAPALAASILHGMDFNGGTVEHLSRDECLRLLGQVPVGRIVFTRQALPAVEVVNFAMDD